MLSVYKNRTELKKDVDLGNYYYFSKYFNNNDIEKILSIAEKYSFQKAKVATTVNESYRSSKIKWLPNNNETKWLYDKLSYIVKKTNNKMWKFDIIGFGEDIQIGEYTAEEGGHYDWHLDLGKQSCFRKISISVQLSNPDEYEGGDLQLYTGKAPRIAPKEKGTAILFPSYFLHRVTKITKGVRKSLVLWISGPPFK